MNNVYYRFVRLASHQDHAKLPAMLRMSVTASPGVPKIGSELWSGVPIFMRRGCIRHRFSRVRAGKIG
jgi:alkyl hydroperoxide reductase subunit D